MHSNEDKVARRLAAEDAVENKRAMMTTAPVEKLVLKLAGPSIVIMLISALYNMADTFFVGMLGTSASAAVGVVFPLMALIQAVGFFFGNGSGNYIARELGANRIDNAAHMASTGFFTSFAAGAVITVAGFLFLDPLARILGATPTILPHAREYARYILLGAPVMASSLMLNNLLRYQGSAFYGMVGMVSGAVLNVGLDPLFIFGFRMGVGGAALATMLSQCLGFVLLLLGCFRKDNIRIRLKFFRPSFANYKEMVRGGLPSLFRQGMASVATICVNQMAGAYGDAAIAALSIVQRITQFAASALIGFGQGFQPVCGFNYGAKLYARVKRAYLFCAKSSAVVLVALAAAGFAFAPQVIALFRDDPAVIEIGSVAMRLQCIVFPFMGVSLLTNMMLQTIGKPFAASLLALSRSGLFLLPALFILTPLLGILGLQLSQPVADFVSFILAVLVARSAFREMDALAQQADPFVCKTGGDVH